jgi:P27 family predicted phage terminase small subunit
MMPRKNNAVHFLHGTKSRVKDNAPGFVSGRPKCPKHLCAAARKEFKRCVNLLATRGTLTEGDGTLLALYAEIYSRWVATKETIGTDLMIQTQVTDNNGNLRTVTRLNPLLKVLDVCESKLVTLAAKLGITPVDRARSKQTEINPQRDVVPGSLEDTNPELFSGAPVIPFVPLAPESIDEETDVTDGQ